MTTKASIITITMNITAIMAEAITDGVITRETTKTAKAIVTITVAEIAIDRTVSCEGWLSNQLDFGCLVRSLVDEVSASS